VRFPRAPCPVHASVIVLVDVDDFDAMLAGEAGALTAVLVEAAAST
jgi:hypothetical protein